jgi:hypothetical protein
MTKYVTLMLVLVLVAACGNKNQEEYCGMDESVFIKEYNKCVKDVPLAAYNDNHYALGGLRDIQECKRYATNVSQSCVIIEHR